MKITLLAVIGLFLTKALLAQENTSHQEKTLEYKDFRINGLYFIATKEDIIKKFGKPEKIFEPKYECGFFSTDQPGAKYYSLQYAYFKFIGNKVENYSLEEIHFNAKMDFSITYKGKALSNKTTKKGFEAMFEIKMDGDEVSFFHKNADDALIFTFVNGRLSHMELWTPC